MVQRVQQSCSYFRSATIFSILLFLLTTADCIAQVYATSLRGLVTDPVGAVITTADVKLANTAEGFSRTVTTNANGEYQFLQVPPGTYSVNISAAGFANARRESVVL